MPISAADVRHEGSAERGRYTHAFADGAEAELSYAVRDGAAVITHTFTPPSHRGQGTAAVLVERAVTDFRAAGLKVVPACWFAREEFDRHPEWADLLQRSQT